MTVLICRLGGPLQSWGDDAKYIHRGSLPYPSYAGLLGLARAACGYDRAGRDAHTGQPGDDQWLRQLTMAIRIDQPGTTLVDNHTVNPPPLRHYRWLSTADRSRLGAVPMGNSKPWAIPTQRGDRKEMVQQTLQTWRTYLTDAVFTWFITGESDHIHRLQTALAEPYWQLSLGRKACPPDQPMLLGATDQPLDWCVANTPATGDGGRRPVHLLTGDPAAVTAASDARRVTHVDLPLGTHPHHGYGYLTRTVTHVTPPAANRVDLLLWAKENLR